MTAKLLAHSVHSKPAAGAQFGLAPHSRIVRDFVLLITICVSVGVSRSQLEAVLSFRSGTVTT